MTWMPARRRFLRGHLALMLALSGRAGTTLAERSAALGPRITRRALAFGTRVSVTVAGADEDLSRRAADAALAEMAAVESIASLHTPGSPLARLNRDGKLVHADPRLVDLVRASLHWSAATDGAFDITVQPLWRLYFAEAARGRVPDPSSVERVRERVDWRSVRVSDRTIVLDRSDMQATLNGMAQGYAADRAWEVLRDHGIENALVDAGEWRASGRPGDDRRWRLGVRDPASSASGRVRLVDAVSIQDAALATSGNDGYRFTADGSLFHILDPRTGRSPCELISATVIAPDAASADALSTACMVLGLERSVALVEARPGAAGLLVRRDGTQVATAGWPTRDSSFGLRLR